MSTECTLPRFPYYLNSGNPDVRPNALKTANTAMIINNTLIICGNGAGSGINETNQYNNPISIKSTMSFINIFCFY
jgi:hypothetical protein